VKRLAAIVLAALFAGSCAGAPDPGDLGTFCTLLETGTGLTPSPTAEDLDRLALVAPPAVRETIEALQGRAQDFNELLAAEPPDLEALFNARFDPQAVGEQAALDRFALTSCGIAVDRPAGTKWTNYVRENLADEVWPAQIVPEIAVSNDSIESFTAIFAERPTPVGLVEDACRGISEFLIAEGEETAQVRVLIDAFVALEYDSPRGLCQLP